jgi:hypothetical protein
LVWGTSLIWGANNQLSSTSSVILGEN